MAKPLKNIGASVRMRLLKLAQSSGQSFEIVLTRFALERLLFRLSKSEYANQFVLKGAMVMLTWFNDPHRSTRDLDLLGYGDPEPENMLAIFRGVLSLDVDDGVRFNVAALRVERIREELEYGGLRLRTTAEIAGARINVVIDIGFGDAIEPQAELINYPGLLDFETPRLRAYPRETVIAEKFQAMIALGLVNSRMKDYYDIWMLSRNFAFNEELSKAIAATFARRKTLIPNELPVGLSAAFASDLQKQRQWRAFVENVAVDPGELASVVNDLSAFLMPMAAMASSFLARVSK
jgi:predicted nucleotidyltransferase component of viral defense system